MCNKLYITAILYAYHIEIECLSYYETLMKIDSHENIYIHFHTLISIVTQLIYSVPTIC